MSCLVDLVEPDDVRVLEPQQEDGHFVLGLALQGHVPSPPTDVLGGEDLSGGAVAGSAHGSELAPGGRHGGRYTLVMTLSIVLSYVTLKFIYILKFDAVHSPRKGLRWYTLAGPLLTAEHLYD